MTKHTFKLNSKSRLGNFLINCILLIISTIIGLLVSEIIIRHYVQVGSYKIVKLNGLPRLIHHSIRKYTYTPGFKGRLQHPEFDTLVEINSLGFRGPEPKPASSNKSETIFVIGDSFVFGTGVEYEDSIPSRLQYYLENDLQTKVDVWNLSVSGYATQQYMYMLENYLKYRKPLFVIVCFYVGSVPSAANDMTASVSFEKWERKQNNNSPQKLANNTRNTPATKKTIKYMPLFPKIKKWLIHNAAIYNFIFFRVGPYIRAVMQSRHELNSDEIKLFQRGLEIFQEQIVKLQKLADEHKFNTTVVYFPDYPDLINNFTKQSNKIHEICNLYNIPFIDGFRILKDGNHNELYYAIDGHFNKNGYNLMARKIAQSIIAQNYKLNVK